MALFNPDCRQCPRLASHLESVKQEYPNYHCAPVPPIGSPDSKFLIVGLAPGKHGANQTGRPFTGDDAGNLLFSALKENGFSTEKISAVEAVRLAKRGVRITNAVKCLPPNNAPSKQEFVNCSQYLLSELELVDKRGVVLALGEKAHSAVLRALGVKQVDYKFSHGAEHQITERFMLLDSYHTSRYNQNTGRITSTMFDAVIKRVKELLVLAAN